MLLATNLITEEIYRQAKSAGVYVFLYNEIEFIPPENENDEEIFFNCASQRVASTWFTWEENEKVIEDFKKRFPQLFNMLNADLTLALKKAMFWSNYKTGTLHYSVKEYF